MKKELLPVILLLAVIVLFSRCATIVSKTSYNVYIHTDPARATVSVTNINGKEIYKGASPATVRLNAGAGFFKKAAYHVKITSPGFEERIIPVTFKLNGWYFGNLLIGGLIGMLIVDPATGAMWKIKDPVVDETLIKNTGAANATPGLKIIDIKDMNAGMKEKLVRLN
jgi:hypothetical protein